MNEDFHTIFSKDSHQYSERSSRLKAPHSSWINYCLTMSRYIQPDRNSSNGKTHNMAYISEYFLWILSCIFLFFNKILSFSGTWSPSWKAHFPVLSAAWWDHMSTFWLMGCEQWPGGEGCAAKRKGAPVAWPPFPLASWETRPASCLLPRVRAVNKADIIGSSYLRWTASPWTGMPTVFGGFFIEAA